MAETTQPHVLLVDDSTVYLTLADILFAELAVTLVVAQGGWAALAACEWIPRPAMEIAPILRNSRRSALRMSIFA